MYRSDTIVARATPAGRAAIAIVRLSGPEAFSIASGLLRPKGARGLEVAWRLSRFEAMDPTDQRVLDDVLAVRMPGPATYTGEDVVEIHCHGSPVVVERLVSAALSGGARSAEAGEFTRRAVLNGRMDLLQAEAVIDLIDAPVLASAKAACRQLEGVLSDRIGGIRARLIELLADVEAHIDFTEDDLEEEDTQSRLNATGEILRALAELSGGFHAAKREREGYRVVFSGKPNVGKSSLFNALLGFDRAIVAEEAGTTRDSIEETVDLDGIGFVIADTAGLRPGARGSEAIAVERSRATAAGADVSIRVIDGSAPLSQADLDALRLTAVDAVTLCAINKSDLGDGLTNEDRRFLGELACPLVRTSAQTGQGVAALRAALVNAVSGLHGDASVTAGITRDRHRVAADRARAATLRARAHLAGDDASELVAVELREALRELAAITDPLDNEIVLDRIFSEFCIGK